MLNDFQDFPIPGEDYEDGDEKRGAAIRFTQTALSSQRDITRALVELRPIGMRQTHPGQQ
jgi:hypothetical protein